MSLVLITGAEGQLGKALQATFKNDFSLKPFFCSKSLLDITNLAEVESWLKAHPVQYIINCAAYTNVWLAEEEVEACFKVNSRGPGNLARLAAKYRIILFHISTDYVFGHGRGRPFAPSDPPDPLNTYGRSKLSGERAIAAHNIDFYIIRTAWLYGPKGDNFFTRMVKRAQKGGIVQMVDDQIGSPTYVYDLAEAIWQIVGTIAQKGSRKYPSGIYHYTNQGVASWYDFAYAILKAFPGRCSLMALSSDATALERPYYSVLDKSSFKSLFQIEIPHWQDSLTCCLAKWQQGP